MRSDNTVILNNYAEFVLFNENARQAIWFYRSRWTILLRYRIFGSVELAAYCGLGPSLALLIT